MFKLLAACVLIASLNVNAKEYKGVQFADEVMVEKTKLVLNGNAARKFWEIIDVYLVGFYLEKKSQDREAILNSKELKHIKMHFLRHVDKSKLQESLKEGFFKNAPKGYEYSADLRKLLDMMPFFKIGEKMEMTFYPDRVDFKIKDEPMQTHAGDKFSYTMLKMFLTHDDFKKGLLGK